MNLAKRFFKPGIVGLFSLILVACQNDDYLKDLDTSINSRDEINSSQLKSFELASSSTTNYLLDLINTIEDMVEKGLLNKGNANALIAKIKNAIKSINKGNTNASNGQLNALINEVEDFIDNGILPEEGGEMLINEVETGIILSEGGFVDPIDGTEYSVVLMGDQLWMAENLRTTKYNDGSDIPLVIDDEEWTNLLTPGYCWFNNDPDINSTTYGALYNWYTVETGKLCPTGWHVPTISEASTLVNYLANNGYGYEGSGDDVAKSLAFTSGWNTFSYEEGAVGNDQASNNSTGFSGLASGLRGGRYEGEGMFFGVGSWGWWWTASEHPGFPESALDIRLRYSVSTVLLTSYDKSAGVYVRCLKD